VPKACALRLRPGLSARRKLLDFRNRASHARLSSHFRGGGSGAGAISRVVDKIVQARREFGRTYFLHRQHRWSRAEFFDPAVRFEIRNADSIL
jgi:hypothetical protein